SGALDRSRRVFRRALHLGGRARTVRARVNQNLGILANIQGRLIEARQWYERSLSEYRATRDEHGCAIAHHNLGMVSADAHRYDEAERHLRASLVIARRRGDRFLEALCLVNQADVDFARQSYESARQHAEAALALFEHLGARGAKSDAYRVIGMVYRETGKPILAESRLCSAIALAVSGESVLSEAEARRELAIVYQGMGRNQKALRSLHDAYHLFRRLDAQADLIFVGGKMAELETTYRAVVRAWGRSIESSDSYTFGHCERVARLAVGVAQVLGFDNQQETTVLLGAYLHDVGMVRMPHEVLQKDGALTDAERRLLEMHPAWGVELLANVEFPWDIKGVVRWHHEHCDGSGYPDRLTATAIPIAAQIVGIAECYDDLTSARGPRRGVPRTEEALGEIRRRATWWAPEVVAAFDQVVAGICPSSNS
ncbi:MAG: HD domain-containing phosphohydrolase, partial [Gemmatimonadaceae bacterium]